MAISARVFASAPTEGSIWVTRGRDVSSLVEAVEQLVEDPAWRKEMGERAREKVESSYSWRDYGNKVIAKLQELKLK